jgi:hypothetical protein
MDPKSPSYEEINVGDKYTYIRTYETNSGQCEIIITIEITGNHEGEIQGRSETEKRFTYIEVGTQFPSYSVKFEENKLFFIMKN